MTPASGIPDDRGTNVSPTRLWVFRGLVAGVTLLLVVGLFPALKGLFVNWLPRDVFLAVRTDIEPADAIHRLHSTVLAAVFWTLIIGLAAQLWSEAEHVALLAMSFAVLVSQAVAELLAGAYTVAGTGVPLLLLAVVALLHPARWRAAWIRRWHMPSVVLALIALAPASALTLSAAAQRRAAVAGSIDAQNAHLTTVAALGILLVLLGLLGGSEMPGWRPVSWIAAGLASVLALQSLLFPATLSSVGAGWAVATLAWAAALVVVTERRARGR